MVINDTISIVTIKCYDGMYYNVSDELYFRLEKDAKKFLSDNGYLESENYKYIKDKENNATLKKVKIR